MHYLKCPVLFSAEKGNLNKRSPMDSWNSTEKLSMASAGLEPELEKGHLLHHPIFCIFSKDFSMQRLF